MKIVTAYNFKGSSPEVLDDERITDGTQYMSITEVVRRSARGEVLDLKDYSDDLPIDRMEKFDIYDHADQIKRDAEEFIRKVHPEKEQPVSPTPSEPPAPMIRIRLISRLVKLALIYYLILLVPTDTFF